MNLISIADLSPGEILEILDRADEMKARRSGPSEREILDRKSVG